MKTANWKTGLLSAMVLLLFFFEAYCLNRSIQEITVSAAFERTSPENVTETISSLRLVNVKGKVVNEAGEPLIGVSIIIKGTDKGTVTDLSGSFTLEQLSETDVMVFSYIGYLTQEVPVGNRSEFDITLQED